MHLGNMKCLKILFTFCVLYILAAVAEKDEHKRSHQSKEKSHHSNNRNEKTHILNRQKNTETRTHSSSHFQHLAYRDGSQHCQVICNGSKSNSSDIQVLYNGDAGLIAYLNQSAYIAVIQDYFSNITVILNGQSGSAIVEDISKEKFYSIEKSAQTEGVLWISSKSDFSTFFKNLTSLQKFVKLGEEHGKSINRGEDLSKAKYPYLRYLDFNPSDSNFTLSVDLIIQLNTTLRFIFKGQGTFTLHKHIIWFTNVSLAFAEIFRDCQNQLESSDLKLNLTKVYGAYSGVEALVNLLTQIGTRVDLAKILRNELNSPEKLLELLAKLSGGSNEGVDGIITIVITAIRAINGHASITDVINAILNYKPGEDDTSLAKVIDETLDLIQSQNRLFNNSEAFKGIVTVLKAINNQNFVYKNINISDIITLIASRNPVTIIQTIIRIFTRFASGEGFSQTLRGFIESFNTTIGFNIIARLFPGSNFDTIRHCISTILSNIPIIGNIFKNLSNVGNNFNISNVVNTIPIIGPAIANGSSGIVSGIEHAIQNIVGPFIGSGHNGAPSGVAVSTPATSERSSSITKTNGTEAPHTGDNGTHSSSPSQVTPEPECNSTSSKGSESSNSSRGSVGTERPKSASTKEALILRAAKMHDLHEKKNNHHLHLDVSSRKENAHERHRFQEKGHHGHASNRKENLHLKYNLQEKNNYHGHLRESNKHENVHHRHKAHEKDSLQKIHSNAAQEKKHQDHHH